MSLAVEIFKALLTRPRSVFRTAAVLIPRMAARHLRKVNDSLRSSFDTTLPEAEGPLLSYLNAPSHESLKPHAAHLAALCDLYLDHRYNLLGSGWVKLGYGMECRGLEGHKHKSAHMVEPDTEGLWLKSLINPPNLKESRSIWRMAGDNYTPMDWQLDYKSGFRWSQKQWYLDVAYGNVVGADVKMPWELARFQHLPHLALGCQLAVYGQKGFQKPQVYRDEFCNQVLDFIALNPPRFGVNWSSNIEVALRVSSWLLAYDLFAAAGAAFDQEFKTVFQRSVYEHARHIAANFEWMWELRGNHYLGNVVGLLMAAAFLPAGPEVDAWLALAIQELIDLVQSNFGDDGGNFEASTSYHRFCAEMVVYATAICMGLPEEKLSGLESFDHRLIKGRPSLARAPSPYAAQSATGRAIAFPSWFVERLASMARFTKSVTRPDGRAPQIGDNDNARFLKIPPVMHSLPIEELPEFLSGPPSLDDSKSNCMYWEEDFQNHTPLINIISALLGEDGCTAGIEAQVILALSGGRVLKPQRSAELEPRRHSQPGRIVSHALPDFGLYVFRSSRIFLCLRCGHLGQNGYGGHAHNDQLALELCWDGVPFLVDPGTYQYTALPQRRNQFRGAAMHNTIQADGREQNTWPQGMGLFRTDDNSRASVELVSENRFEGAHYGFGAECRRVAAVGPESLWVEDSLDGHTGISVYFQLAPEVSVAAPGPSSQIALHSGRADALLRSSNGSFTVEQSVYSPGYGIIQKTLRLKLSSGSQSVTWEFLPGSS